MHFQGIERFLVQERGMWKKFGDTASSYECVLVHKIWASRNVSEVLTVLKLQSFNKNKNVSL